MSEKIARREVEAPHPVAGIFEGVFNEDGEVFLLKGDRHHWVYLNDGVVIGAPVEGCASVKNIWEKQFHVEGDMKAPFQIFTVKEKLIFLGKEYSALQQAVAILAYCVSKKWMPKMFFNLEQAREVVKTGEYCSSKDDLLAFHAMLMEFTAMVADHHYLELVAGAVEGTATTDLGVVAETRVREVMEEAGVTTEADFVAWSDPFTSRKTGETTVSAIFKSFVPKQQMLDSWAATMKQRRPTGFEWACPHAWYKKLNVDLAAAKAEKSNLETLGGGWFPMSAHSLMDRKNLAVLSKFN